jgi:hypothetical protein
VIIRTTNPVGVVARDRVGDAVARAADVAGQVVSAAVVVEAAFVAEVAARAEVGAVTALRKARATTSKSPRRSRIFSTT